MTRGQRTVSLCGGEYHPIKSCLECHRLYMQRYRRTRKRSPHVFGFRGPECIECGGIRSEVRESGWTDAGQRIRRRVCLDCGQDACSVEVYVDPSETTFWRLNGERLRRKRKQNYEARGKGIYRVPKRWVNPDDLIVTVRVVKPARAAA